MGSDESGAPGTKRAHLGTNPPLRVSHHPGPSPLSQTKNRNHFVMSTFTTEPTTSQNQSPQSTTQPTNTPTTQLERNAATNLRT